MNLNFFVLVLANQRLDHRIVVHTGVALKGFRFFNSRQLNVIGVLKLLRNLMQIRFSVDYEALVLCLALKVLDS